MSTWSRLAFNEETLGIPGVQSLGQYNYVAAKAGSPQRQQSGCVELRLLVKGHQAYRIGGENLLVKGGEQYVFLPEEKQDPGSEPQDKGILYWLRLDVTKDRNKFLFLAPAMARRLVSDLLSLPSRHFAAAPESHAVLDKAFHALRQIRTPDECTGLFKKSGPLKASVVDGLNPEHPPLDDSFHLLEAANAIASYILQTIHSARANIRSVSPVIKTSLDFIAKNEEVWLNVAHVAEKVHLSESYFKILFREEVGLPPAEYMLRQKIDIAKALLSKPNCNITDLAYRLGFSSSQYFATVFKRFVNQTPSEFMRGQHPELIPITN
jgi:AraC-like DNA-binding protein